MNASDRPEAWRATLSARAYGLTSGDFVRPRPDELDDVVVGVVRATVAATSGEREALRRRLTEGEIDTVRLFAMRRTLQGRRQASLSSLEEALDAYTLLPGVEEVPWESWLKAALFVSRFLGRDLDSLSERFSDLASRQTAARFDVAVEAMDRVEAIAQCHVVETTTNHGTGFIETLVFRDRAARGLFGAPRLADHSVEFDPTTNLAQLAVTVADALDATTRVRTGPIGQDQLAAPSFGRSVSGSYLACAGCLSFVGELERGAPFTVFVAELFDDEDAASLVMSANELEGQLANSDQRRLVLLSAQPSFDENDDAEVDVEEFDGLVRSALFEPAPASWRPS